MPDLQTAHPHATAQQPGGDRPRVTPDGKVTATHPPRRPAPTARFLAALGGRRGHSAAGEAAETIPAARPRKGVDVRHWQSSAAEPELVVECRIPAGWVRVSFDIETASNQTVEIHLDTGGDFNSAEVLRVRGEDQSFTSDRCWFVPRPIRAVRLAPGNAGQPFRIRNFAIRPVSKLNFYARAVGQLVSQAATQRRLLTITKKGLKALATGNFRRIGQQIRGRSHLSGIDTTYDYNAWIEKHQITPAACRNICRQFKRWTSAPTLSVLLAVDDLAPDELRASLESVCRQIYPHWQLIVVARSSLATAARSVLDEFARLHERITVHRLHADGGEAEALNHALSVASGAFAVVLTSGDRLAEHALFHVAREIVNHPEVDWIYSDEDQLSATGQRILPFFKPDWSPELIVSSPYTGHLSAYRVSLVRMLGGWRSALAGAHHYDLALRASEATANIRHVPDVLYHARPPAHPNSEQPGAEPTAVAERLVLVDHFRRAGLPATVEPSPVGGYHRVRRAVRGNPLVSVVIPTASQGVERDGAFVWHVLNCVRSIREQSTYSQIEIVVVDNNDMPRALADSLRPYGVVQVPYTRRFNLSAKMNLGAQRSRGDYVVFLNDDIEMISPDWAEGMLEHAQDRQVGAVGVKLLFPNDHVQHAGVIWTEFGPDHLFYDEKQAALARYLPALVPRELMAVTGACVMVKKTDHDLIGGWNEALPLNFNDIDLCLRLIDRGRRNIYTPYVTMRHYESASKTNDEKIDANIQRECKVFMDIWRGKYPVDPYYNPNFILARAFYRIDSRSA